MIAVRELSFAYRRGAEELFNGLTHEFTPGAVTALTGPSGRGKSTLLYIMGLMLRPSQGEVVLDGEEISQANDRYRSQIRAQKIGFVFQDAALDPSRAIIDSVIEPALYAGKSPSEVRERAQELLEQMGVASRADHRPGEISGGQAQRVAVCRALITDPAVILADEPTGNLDQHNAEEVLTRLSTVATEGQRTVIIATHDPFVIDHADEVVDL